MKSLSVHCPKFSYGQFHSAMCLGTGTYRNQILKPPQDTPGCSDKNGVHALGVHGVVQ